MFGSSEQQFSAISPVEGGDLTACQAFQLFFAEPDGHGMTYLAGGPITELSRSKSVNHYSVSTIDKLLYALAVPLKYELDHRLPQQTEMMAWTICPARPTPT
jgi:hypothetical protein